MSGRNVTLRVLDPTVSVLRDESLQPLFDCMAKGWVVQELDVKWYVGRRDAESQLCHSVTELAPGSCAGRLWHGVRMT